MPLFTMSISPVVKQRIIILNKHNYVLNKHLRLRRNINKLIGHYFLDQAIILLQLH